MKKSLFLLAIASFFIVSCSKDNDESIENSNVAPILPRVITVVENGVVTSTSNYFYNGNKILRIESTDNYKESKTEFTYTGDLITSEKWFYKLSASSSFTLSNEKYYTYYNDNKIKTLEESRPGLTTEKFIYTYPSNNQVLCTEVVIDGTQQEKLFSKATINMIDNNVTSVNVIQYDFSTNQPNGYGYSKVCFYDQQNKIEKNILGYNQCFNHNHIISLNNNILGSTSTDFSTGVTTSLPLRTIIYDSNGYPTTIYSYDANGILDRTVNVSY